MLRLENDYYVWRKGDRDWLSKHFRLSEFECHCMSYSCSKQRISFELIAKLEELRAQFRHPIVITSGFRCAAHQDALRKVGFETANGVSQHELGNAADITSAWWEELKPLLGNNFKAVGIGRNFAHVDTRNDKERRWQYNKTSGLEPQKGNE